MKKSSLGGKSNLSTSRLKELVFKQKCIPWRVSNYLDEWLENWLRTRSWRLYRLFKYRKINVNTREYWNKMWNGEDSFVFPALYEKVVNLVPAGSKVLDVGCGSGDLLGKLKEEKSCNVWGLDISDVVINTLREKGIDGVVSKLPKIPFPDEKFDVVVSTEVLEHITNPKKTILQMVRTLRKGGLLIVSVPENSLHPEDEIEHLNIFDEERLKDLLSPLVEIHDTCRETYLDGSDDYYLMISGYKI